jgi:hypothetical protein
MLPGGGGSDGHHGAPPSPPPAAGWLGPRFRRARFRAAVHHLCWACEDPRALGAERLHLVLWYADRNLHLRRGRPLTGATYVRHRAGPRARPLEAQLRELERDGLLARRPRGGGADGPDQQLLFALAPPPPAPAPGRLDAEEVAELEAAFRGVCLGPRAAAVPRRAAHDAVWRAALIGEALPYLTACAGQAGDLLPADVRWAAREAEAGPPAGGGAARLGGGGLGLPRAREAVEALLWHLRRDPGLGASLPGTEGSWFAHKQAGLAAAGVPEVVAVYRFELDELLPAAVRVGPAPPDPEDDDGDGGDEGG